MRAAEAVDLARRTGRCLLVRIIKARGAPVSNDDDLWGSGDEARRVVEGSVALVLDEDGEDAGFLRAAYTEIVEAEALVLISGETGEQLLLLQGEEDLGDPHAVEDKLAKAFKAEYDRKVASFMALAAAAKQQQGPTPTPTPTPTTPTPTSEPETATTSEKEEEEEEEGDGGVTEGAPGRDDRVLVEPPARESEPSSSNDDDDDEEEEEEEEAQPTPAETRLQVRLLNGSQLSFEVGPSSTMAEVYDYVRSNRTDGDKRSFALKVPFSSGGSLGEEQMGCTMQDLGLHPRSSLILVPAEGGVRGGAASGSSASGSRPSDGGLLAAILRFLSFIFSALASLFQPQAAVRADPPLPRRPRAESNSEDGKRGDQEYWNGNSVEFLSGGDTKKDQ